MAKALDVVTDALRLINYLSAEETPSAADAAFGLTKLNDMLFGWKLKGVDLQPVTMALTDMLPFDDAYLRGIKNNLAVELAAPFERPVPPGVAVTATGDFEDFQAHTLEFDDDLQVDTALQPRHFRRRAYSVTKF